MWQGHSTHKVTGSKEVTRNTEVFVFCLLSKQSHLVSPHLMIDTYNSGNSVNDDTVLASGGIVLLHFH